jgi:hypothetical protein
VSNSECQQAKLSAGKYPERRHHAGFKAIYLKRKADSEQNREQDNEPAPDKRVDSEFGGFVW